MGAAADLAAHVAHGVDLDQGAVLVAEKAHGPPGTGGLQIHFLAGDLQIPFDGLIDQILHDLELFGSDLFGMREVEPEPFGGDVGAPLADVSAQRLPQGRLQQVRGAVEPRRLFRSVGQTALELLFRSGAGKFLMLLVGFLITGHIHFEILFPGHLDGEFDGEPVGFEEVEGVLARNDLSGDVGRHPVDEFLELLRPLFQGGGELGLFLFQRLKDHVFPLGKFRVEPFEKPDDPRGDAGAEVPLDPQLASFAHRPADEPAEHVGLIGPAGGDAVADDEARSPQMVGDDPVRSAPERRGHGLDAADQIQLGEKRRENFRFIAALLALQHGGDPFEAHAGVHVFLGQGFIFPLGVLVVLHEDVVPDLHPALVFGVELFRRGQGARPIEHLGIRAAGAGDAGGAPPIVLLGKLRDAGFGHAEGAPEIEGLLIEGAVLIAGEDGEAQHVEGQVQILLAREEFEAELDGLFLEVVPQRPVPQHFEEGEVDGVAHLVDIPGADALLVVGEPLARGVLRSLQVGHQGMHPGGGEKTGGVIFGDQRSAADLGMTLALEKFDKTAANLFSLHIRNNLLKPKLDDRPPRRAGNRS